MKLNNEGLEQAARAITRAKCSGPKQHLDEQEEYWRSNEHLAQAAITAYLPHHESELVEALSNIIDEYRDYYGDLLNGASNIAEAVRSGEQALANYKPDMVAHLKRLQNHESELEFYKQNVIVLEADAEPIVDDVVMIGNCVMHVVEDGTKENIFVSLKDAKQAWLDGDLQWILSRNGKAAICEQANYKERV